MTSALFARNRSTFFAAPVLGLWAAAIALAPSLEMKAALLAPAAVLPLLWWTLQRPARWIALFFGTALLLPPLPIPIGSSGPHPSMVFAALGFFCGALWLSEWHIPATSLNGAFFILAGVMFASVAMAAIHSGETAAAGSIARLALFSISIFVFFYTAYGPGSASVGGCHALY